MQTLLFITSIALVAACGVILMLKKQLAKTEHEGQEEGKRYITTMEDRADLIVDLNQKNNDLELKLRNLKATSVALPSAFLDILNNGYQLAAVSVDCEWRLHNENDPAIYFAAAFGGKPGFYIRGMRWTAERFAKKLQGNAG
jgi:hypothetical protein